MLCQSVCAFPEYSLKQSISSLFWIFFPFWRIKKENFIISLHRRATFVSLFLYMNLLQQITGYCSLCDDLEARGGFFLFPFFYVLFLYLLCFWFCSCWIDLHMCYRQSSGLHAHPHMCCLYQEDPPWDLHALLQLKLLSFKNRAYWHVSLQTNKRKEKNNLKFSVSWERNAQKQC